MEISDVPKYIGIGNIKYYLVSLKYHKWGYVEGVYYVNPVYEEEFINLFSRSLAVRVSCS